MSAVEPSLGSAEPRLDELVSRMRRPSVGAVVSYVGLVRSEPGLERFEVRAGEGAAEELERIRREALSLFEVEEVAIGIHHGDLAVGDAVLVAAVAAAHRGPAFEACSFVVDSFKRSRTVTAREVRAGEGGAARPDGIRRGGKARTVGPSRGPGRSPPRRASPSRRPSASRT